MKFLVQIKEGWRLGSWVVGRIKDQSLLLTLGLAMPLIGLTGVFMGILNFIIPSVAAFDWKMGSSSSIKFDFALKLSLLTPTGFLPFVTCFTVILCVFFIVQMIVGRWGLMLQRSDENVSLRKILDAGLFSLRDMSKAQRWQIFFIALIKVAVLGMAGMLFQLAPWVSMVLIFVVVAWYCVGVFLPTIFLLAPPMNWFENLRESFFCMIRHFIMMYVLVLRICFSMLGLILYNVLIMVPIVLLLSYINNWVLFAGCAAYMLLWSGYILVRSFFMISIAYAIIYARYRESRGLSSLNLE